MGIHYGYSCSGSAAAAVSEALEGIRRPALVIFSCTLGDFEAVAAELQSRLPQALTIGTTAAATYSTPFDRAATLTVAAFDDCVCAGGLLREIGRYPKKYVGEIRAAVNYVSADGGDGDTLCIEFTTGAQKADELVQDTYRSVLKDTAVKLAGGTSAVNCCGVSRVAWDGEVYDDASAFVIMRNPGKKIRLYSHNSYAPGGLTLQATRVDVQTRTVYEYDHMPAADAVAQALCMPRQQFEHVCADYPIGCLNGDGLRISSAAAVNRDGSIVYRSRIYGYTTVHLLVNSYEPLTLLRSQLCSMSDKDNREHSFALIVSCGTRLQSAERLGLLEKGAALTEDIMGPNMLIATDGEQLNGIHVNQTMITVLFE